MNASIKRTLTLLILSASLITICILFAYFTPESSSWLHQEEYQTGTYKIGRIDLWLDNIEENLTQINISPRAPTRFFQQTDDRDANFNIAVENCRIYAANKGDIDLKTDLSIIDNNPSNVSIFYVFVPADCMDSNFLSGNYRDYLDSVFSLYPTETIEECRTAMNTVNEDTLDSNKGNLILKGEDKLLFYMLLWSEYDHIDNILSPQYVSLSYPVIVNAYSYQNLN